MQALGERDDAGAVEARAVAEDQHRPPGVGDQRDCLLDRRGGRGDVEGGEPAGGAAGGGALRGGALLDLVGDDQVADVALEDGVLEREVDELGVVAVGEHGLAEAGERLEGAGEVDLLKGAWAHHLGADLAGDGEHGGAGSIFASQMPVMRLVAPGPAMARQAAGRPVSLA